MFGKRPQNNLKVESVPVSPPAQEPALKVVDAPSVTPDFEEPFEKFDETPAPVAAEPPREQTPDDFSSLEIDDESDAPFSAENSEKYSAAIDALFLKNEEVESKKPEDAEPPNPAASPLPNAKDDALEVAKVGIFNALIDSVDLAELGKLDHETMRAEIGDIIGEIISVKNLVLSSAEQDLLIGDIINDIMGLGPLEPLLARDDIADIMVNTCEKVYIEVGGRVELTDIRFRDNAQLMNICQRIVSAVGRRIDEASPICDARLADGSRVNAIVPPLAIDGPILTIRKFKKEKLTLDSLVGFGSVSPQAAKVLEIASACRLNILISGGTGSGKTTLLNCLSRQIDVGERVITVEDAAELQLQQPHVVRLETRPPNLEGKGQVTQTDLVKNCLRMRPDRIILGEIRGAEALDMLQAMNTGHDGSMGTIHANNPREALTRLENMIAMGGFELPIKNMRSQIASAVNMVVQASRLRDGSRKITHITEIIGMEGDVVTLQDLYTFEYEGEDDSGKIIGSHRPSGLRPSFIEKAQYYGRERELLQAMEG